MYLLNITLWNCLQTVRKYAFWLVKNLIMNILIGSMRIPISIFSSDKPSDGDNLRENQSKSLCYLQPIKQRIYQ